jgi:hypothetical protein
MILKLVKHSLKDINVQLKKIELKLHIGAVDYPDMQNYLDSNLPLVDTGDRPYVDLDITDEYIIREFGQNIDPIELMWHRDNEDRVVEILNAGNGWQFQYDEKLPTKLQPNSRISIPKHEWHRLWKGEGKLLLKIYKK